MLWELFQLRPPVSFTILLNYRFPFQHSKTWVTELDLLGKTYDLNLQENQETFPMPTGTAEEIFEMVSGSGEEALTRNKKITRNYPKYTSTPNQNEIAPSKQLWNKDFNVVWSYRWKIWFYTGKICPNINATVTDLQHWKGQLNHLCTTPREVLPRQHAWSWEKPFICHRDALFQLIQQPQHREWYSTVASLV